TNTALHSQDSSGWTPAAVTLTNNDAVAPDGTTTAMTMVVSATTALHQIGSVTSFSYTSGDVRGCSCFAKEIPTTWSSTSKNARVVLSNNSLTATSSAQGIAETGFGTVAIGVATGQKRYWEVTVNNVHSTGETIAVGVCNASQSVADGGFLGSAGGTGIGWWNSSNVYFNGSVVTTVQSYTVGDVLCFAVDYDAKKMWFRKNNGLWNNAGGQDPATGTGGIDISAITGTVFPAYTFVDNGAPAGQFTANFGATTFAQTIPSGFSSFSGQWIQFTFGGNSGFNFQPSTGTIGSSLTGTQSAVAVRQLLNGWWRIWFNFTATATTSSTMAVNFVSNSNSTSAPSYAGNGTSKIAVWGFQFESAGAGVTSYIPTTTAAVTRSADNLALPLASVTGWNPNAGGVLVSAFRMSTLKTGIQQDPVYISDGGSNNIDCRAQSGTQAGQVFGLIMRSTAIQINLGANSPNILSAPIFQRRKGAWGWGTSEGQIAADGGGLNTSSGAYVLPVGMTTMNIGGIAGNSLNGTVETLEYYMGARSDSFVVSRTI